MSGVYVEEQMIRNRANRTASIFHPNPNPNSNLNQRPLLGCYVWEDSSSLCSVLDSCAVFQFMYRSPSVVGAWFMSYVTTRVGD